MHRDLKPENLILKDENSFEIVIADFGLASFKTGTLLFKRCGTPGYVAPEILDDKEYDEKVDIFSAGVIYYILLILLMNYLFIGLLDVHRFMVKPMMRFCHLINNAISISTLRKLIFNFQTKVFISKI